MRLTFIPDRSTPLLPKSPCINDGAGKATPEHKSRRKTTDHAESMIQGFRHVSGVTCIFVNGIRSILHIC